MKTNQFILKITVFVITAVFTFSVSIFGFAFYMESSTENTVNFTRGGHNNVEFKETVSQGKILEKEKIIDLVKDYIDVFVKREKQDINPNEIMIDSNFLNLYDIEGNLFAYMISLLYEGKKIGYITIGVVETNSKMYEIAFNGNIEKIKSFIDDKKGKIIFIPPMRYIIETKEGRYYEFQDGDESVVEITEDFKKSKNRIKEIYFNISKSEGKNQTIIKNVNSSGISINPLFVSDYTALVNSTFGKFVPVYDGSNIFYGGNQEWYGTPRKFNGCGPVSAANITCYFAKKSEDIWGVLYSYSTLSKNDFTSHMSDLYSIIMPGTLGASFSDFVRGIESFSSYRGAPLKMVRDNSEFTLINTSTYLQRGLNSDSPVAILNMQPFGEYEYKAHWMTVTEYYRLSDGTRYVTVSTWGERRVINYNEWFDSTRMYGGGLVYFK